MNGEMYIVQYYVPKMRIFLYDSILMFEKELSFSAFKMPSCLYRPTSLCIIL